MELAALLEPRFAALTRRLRTQSLRSGLSITALSVLRRLEDAPARISELAAAEAVAQPSMTALVGRLEERGLVARTRDPDDRRAVRVVLTHAGEELLGATRRARAALLAERLERLDDADRETLRAALPALDRLLDSST
jgi:DNA-binding MarR family transcriptional regulator